MGALMQQQSLETVRWPPRCRPRRRRRLRRRGFLFGWANVRNVENLDTGLVCCSSALFRGAQVYLTIKTKEKKKKKDE